jgi:hypothetical protein
MDAKESDDVLRRLVSEMRKNRPDDPRIELEAQCEPNGIAARWKMSPDDNPDPDFDIGIPNGRNVSWRRISAKKALYLTENSLLGAMFTLGDYGALYFRDAGVIEARCVDARGLRTILSPRRIPGAEYLNESGQVVELSAEDLRGLSFGILRGIGWRVKLLSSVSTEVSAELATASVKFAAFESRLHAPVENRSRVVTLRINNVWVDTHDEALSILRRVSDAILFDLDTCYGLPWQLERDDTRSYGPSWRRKSTPPPVEDAPRFPVNEYASEPMSLYWYARSAGSMPLLEYLAYYQVLEYYFPQYMHQETLGRLRKELRSPRFRLDSDVDLSRLVRIAIRPGRHVGSERDQLRATVQGVVSEEGLREYFAAIPEREEYFSGRQSLKDLPAIQLRDRKNDLHSQVSNRIYDLRCRIVHSKEDGGGESVDLLLPFSREVATIWPDIELLRFLAREALICGAREMSL